MYFDSWSAFFAMGGHGVYVWLAYGATVVTLAAIHLSARHGLSRRLEQISLAAEVEARRAPGSDA